MTAQSTPVSQPESATPDTENTQAGAAKPGSGSGTKSEPGQVIPVQSGAGAETGQGAKAQEPEQSSEQGQAQNQAQDQAQNQTQAQTRAQVPATIPNQAPAKRQLAQQVPPPPQNPPQGPAGPGGNRVAPPVSEAGFRRRHWMTLLSFIFMVILPLAVTGWYLWNRAVDQYASYVGFSVRTEEQGSAIELLGGVTELSGSSSSDTDILYEFLQSQELVAAVDADIDLRSIWSKADPEIDPVFAYHPPGTIEDLLEHWLRKVKIYYDSGTGLIDLRVLAFDPEDATQIATQIYDRSSAMINQLSAIAREDAISYSREELTQAENRLRDARVSIQAFRNRTQIIDPTIQTETQSGLIGALEVQLAEAQIELRLLQETARSTDPRITQTLLKIEVIQQQISNERAELGLEDDNIQTVADLVGAYEALAVDLEFAQQAYTAARATYDSARNEARRQSRYLAAHVRPTKAEKSQYPDRLQILGLMALFLFLLWAVVVLTAYALRDRR